MQITDNFNKVLESLKQTATDVAELNINLINKVSRNAVTPGELSQPKKPEEFMKHMNSINGDMLEYTQGLSEIFVDNTQRLSKILGGAVSETTEKVHRAANTATRVARTAVKRAKHRK